MIKDLESENYGNLLELSELEKTLSNSFSKEQLMNEKLKTKEGESSFEVRERMFSAISEILQNNLNKTIAIVSHGAAIKYYLQNFCEFDSANDVFLLKR